MFNYQYKSDKEKFNTSLDIWEIIKTINGVYSGFDWKDIIATIAIPMLLFTKEF